MASHLSEDEMRRYRRQLIMPDIGAAGQKRLKQTSVMIAGVGGLGGFSALHMAAAGVGRLVIADMDRVADHNLNRQMLYTISDIGRWKTACARDRLTALNPFCQVDAINQAIDSDTVHDMARGCDLVIDGSDNFEMRATLNQAALSLGIPFIFGGVNGFDGMMAVFSPGKGACLRCLFPKAPSPPNGEIGIIGPTVGVIASLQCMEAIKLLTGNKMAQPCTLSHFHGLDLRLKKMVIKRNPSCPACAQAQNRTK